jgi:MFS transporter, ACS family, pantothenate transporter
MFSTNGNYQLWMRGTGDYSIEQVNYVPTSQPGFGIVCTLLLGWYSDYNPRNNRWQVGYLLTITAIISGALMLSKPSAAGRFAAFIINGAQFAGQTVCVHSRNLHSSTRELHS